jgi:hypothetical protein
MKALTLLLLLVGLGLTPHAASASTFTFDTLPATGILSGAAGDTLGFGYTLTNLSATDWLVITSLDAGVFLDGSADASLFDFPVLAPGASLVVPFVAGSAGLFAFTWDPAAPLGASNAGVFTLGGEWWSDDPAAAGSFLALATPASATYQLVVPEPPIAALLAAACVGLGSIGRRRARGARAEPGPPRPSNRNAHP